MGSLSRVRDEDVKVHLLFTNSNKAELFVYDNLKEVCDAGVDSILTVNNKKTFTEMLERINMRPYLSELWLFVIEYGKIVKNLCKQHKSIFDSCTSKFLLKVESYKDFKEAKELLNRNVNDMYLAKIRSDEVMYLLNGYHIPQKTLNFISGTYGNDVDKVFDLKEQLDAGMKIDNPRSVVGLVGVSGGTINKYAMQLLANPPKSARGLNMVLRNRLRDGKILVDTYGASSCRNFLLLAARDILNIKTLYLQGIIFKQIRDLPKAEDKNGKPLYDEKRLSKFNYCLERITDEIPYQRILRLYLTLQGSVWRSEGDLLRFVYNYYKGE